MMMLLLLLLLMMMMMMMMMMMTMCNLQYRSEISSQRTRKTYAQLLHKHVLKTRVQTRVCAHLRAFPFVIHSHNCALCGILLHNKKQDKRQFLQTLLENNCISAEKQTADSHVVGVQSLITDKCPTFSQIFLLWTECKRKKS